MFFGFQLTCGLMMVFYGYSVMKNPRVWGDQGRQAVKAENFPEYCRQNGLFFLKAGLIMALIGALDALVSLSGALYVLLFCSGWRSRSIRWSNGAARTRASPGPGPMWKVRRSGSKSCAGSRNRSSRAALRKNKREPERGALPEEGRALLLSAEVSTLDSRSRRTYNETTMTPLETHLEVQNHDQLSQELCSSG